MPFDHNHHYHPTLLRLLPPGPGRALDVGCGDGRFARKLAAAGMTVEGIDTSDAMIARAAATGSPGPGTVDYRRADVTTEPLEPEAYAYISCLASLHHVPFDTVTTLRDALVPGGVLAVLGCARPSRPGDYARELVAVPANALARLAVFAGDQLNGGPDPVAKAPVRMDFPTLNDVRRDAERLLPGSTVRPLVFWRYLLAWRKPADHPAAG
ncbi:methyltransferase family protein [Amycolatopsis echigonensis]|uniref:Methyltransferase family protein n=1 Tax=Amycolatopsis echigonensis TaxID=2576905 RepID=A0A2N3X0M8_9PSEU|nr:class I SAM-dependent methyltransferase [Amycolatopsis niigatensis]PKV99666.1 methyltransferase family protein [Amycolatopsis niigatensis]